MYETWPDDLCTAVQSSALFRKQKTTFAGHFEGHGRKDVQETCCMDTDQNSFDVKATKAPCKLLLHRADMNTRIWVRRPATLLGIARVQVIAPQYVSLTSNKHPRYGEVQISISINNHDPCADRMLSRLDPP